MLVRPTVAVLYGDAVSAALVYSMKAWREAHAASQGYEGLIGGPIKHVSTNVIQSDLGCARITVTIEGRRKSDTDLYYFEATLTAGELKLETLT